MPAKLWTVLIGTSLTLSAANASTQARARPPARVDVAAGPVERALAALARQTGVDLLFSPATVASRSASAVHGTFTIEIALDKLLAGSGLTYRRSDEGVIVIVVAEAAPEPPIPEILVIGVRTQNADIRRTVNDIQPYRVATAADIQSSHADTLGEYLTSRLPSNQINEVPSQNIVGEYGGTRSEVNLHGLGAGQTLVLVDGMRMPRLPTASLQSDFTQPDLNGIPVTAVDRIETLTSTAGGISGPGATGGVVNVILKRDYRGADLTATSGLTARGDARFYRISGRIGFTPDHGRTDVMISLSHSNSSPLKIGYRTYAEDANARLIAADPAAFVANSPYVNAVLVRSAGGTPLTLRSALGGTALGSTYTYMPIGAGTSGVDGLSTLLANAGRVPTSLSSDGNGSAGSIISRASTSSILVNIRHRFGEGVEAFVDFIRLEDLGRAINGNRISRPITVSSISPNNPFAQSVTLLLPLPGYDSSLVDRTLTTRLTAGLLVKLPASWKMDATAAIGSATQRFALNGSQLSSVGESAIVSGSNADGSPAPNPFGDFESFLAAVASYKQPYFFRGTFRNRFSDLSLRVAGPLFSTSAGAVTLSVLGEARSEKVPAGSVTVSFQGNPADTGALNGVGEDVRSAYAELRAPIVSRQSPLWPLRGLELQFAARKDGVRITVPSDEVVLPGAKDQLVTARLVATVFTAGLRAYPVDWLMLRGSVATGIVPPLPEQFLGSSTFQTGDGATDPERGRRLIGSEGPFKLLFGGSTNLKPERAQTTSLGLVLNPEGRGRPRLSLDYTHIHKTSEVVDAYHAQAAYFVANGALYPGRVVRAPLTDADRLAGFTGGVITQIDTTSLNIGETTTDAVDVDLDYTLATGSSSSLRLYGAATWEPRFHRYFAPDRPIYNYVGLADGPLRWRANGGFQWSKSRLAVGVNGQYYGSYCSITSDDAIRGEPCGRIPPQVYFDLSASYRFRLSGVSHRTLDVRFGIQDILDHSPPIVAANAMGYSYYGDPRRRRFDLTLAMHL